MHLCFEVLVVGPRRVHKVILVVGLEVLNFFLFLVIVAEHTLVLFSRDDRLSLRCTSTSLLELDNKFLLLVFAEIIAKDFT